MLFDKLRLAASTVLFVAAFCDANKSAIYKSTNDDRCMLPSQIQLQTSFLTNHRQCAIQCLTNADCGLYAVDFITNSCLLYPIMTFDNYLSTSVHKPSVCKIWYIRWLIPYAIFIYSGTFVVPKSVTFLKVLAVGGGGGAKSCDAGGGGSGIVSFANLTVTPNQVIDVVIGDGGSPGNDGGSTTFGGNLLVAPGGTTANLYIGGSGGSGGGGGKANCYKSGDGGSAGGNGGNSGCTLNAGGSGQGSSFTSDFSQFRHNTLSAGSGAVGANSDMNSNMGGGGGGGVLLGNTGLSGGASNCYFWTCGPGSATGYGAGGSASFWLWLGLVCGTSAGGASGLVYIEY